MRKEKENKWVWIAVLAALVAAVTTVAIILVRARRKVVCGVHCPVDSEEPLPQENAGSAEPEECAKEPEDESEPAPVEEAAPSEEPEE